MIVKEGFVHNVNIVDRIIKVCLRRYALNPFGKSRRIVSELISAAGLVYSFQKQQY